MNGKRLLALADALERAMPVKLNMDNWFSKPRTLLDKVEERMPYTNVDESTVVIPLVEDAVSCGTAACAVGYAMLLPEFQEQGLTMQYNAPYFMGLRKWSAVEEFFGLYEFNAFHLFHPDEYRDEGGYSYNPTPAQVAQRIRDFVAKGG